MNALPNHGSYDHTTHYTIFSIRVIYYILYTLRRQILQILFLQNPFYIDSKNLFEVSAFSIAAVKVFIGLITSNCYICYQSKIDCVGPAADRNH